MKQKEKGFEREIGKEEGFEVYLALDTFDIATTLTCTSYKLMGKRGHKSFLSGKKCKESKAAEQWRRKHHKAYRQQVVTIRH